MFCVETMEHYEINIPEFLKCYKVLQFIGKGGYAVVFQVQQIISQKIFAAKVHSKKNIKDTDQLQMVQNEVSILRLLRHPNIIRCYDVFEMKNDEGEELIIIIEDFCPNGTLLKLINRGIGGEIRRKKIMITLIEVLVYLNEKGIAHCDIKPENILLDENFDMKLIDFGFSKNMNKKYSNDKCGSEEYMAPEMCNQRKANFFKSDIWSLAVLFYVMEERRFPYTDVRDLSYGFEVSMKNEKLKNMLNKCFQILPNFRPSAKELLKDEYFAVENDGKERIKKEAPKSLLDSKTGEEIIE